jgi:hypothetical protein
MLGKVLIFGRGDKAFLKDCSALEAKRRKRKKITNFSKKFLPQCSRDPLPPLIHLSLEENFNLAFQFLKLILGFFLCLNDFLV